MAHTVVPRVPLVSQTQSRGCWYACLQMMVLWHRVRYRYSPGEPAIDAPQVERALNSGMAQDNSRSLFRISADMGEAARSVGLTPLQLGTANPTAPEVERWLQCVGPILVNGRWIDPITGLTRGNHVVVLIGIDEGPDLRGVNRQWLYVHNPGPVDHGSLERRPFEWLAQTLTPRLPVSMAYYRADTCQPQPSASNRR
jgi:hypothetical protein